MNLSSEIYRHTLGGIKTTNHDLFPFSLLLSLFLFFLCIEIDQFGMLSKYSTFTALKMILKIISTHNSLIYESQK